VSEKFPRIAARELIRALRRGGFVEVRQKGSHLQLKNASTGKRVTIPVHSSDNIPIGTLKAIVRDAGFTDDEFKKLVSP
jgi:predicted RNA binding protein YcfA (HicA-like mRNA interferase family)